MATTKHPVALTAGAVTTVTLPVNAGRIEVVMKSTTPADVYFRTDGTNPTQTGADGDHYLPGVAGASLIVDDETPAPGSATASTVKLISAGTPSVAVRAINL